VWKKEIFNLAITISISFQIAAELKPTVRALAINRETPVMAVRVNPIQDRGNRCWLLEGTYYQFQVVEDRTQLQTLQAEQYPEYAGSLRSDTGRG
jgi:hypothetical protein